MFGHDDNDTSNEPAAHQNANDAGALLTASDLSSLSDDGAAPTARSAPAVDDSPADPPAAGRQSLDLPSSADALIDIKQEALLALTPLIGHLDQSPEERFRTTMMMIQASDNQALIGDAYESAKKIASEKDRAQALLDIVNEINYFTQQHNA